jgi:hypothetical protein
MTKAPTDADLGQSLRLVRVVNRLRVTNDRQFLVHSEVLDWIAWAGILKMQTWQRQPANFMRCDVPDAHVRKTGYRADALEQFLAFNIGNGWRDGDLAAQVAIKGWATCVADFSTQVVDKSYRGCGAARLNNSCVLILSP